MDLNAYIRELPGKGRCDLSPLLADADMFARLIDELVGPFRSAGITHVAGLDAMGFILGGAAAVALGAGFVPVRKEGKAAWFTVSRRFIDYTGESKSFHLVNDALGPGDCVLLVDDWAETGAQLEAAAGLCRSAGAEVVGAAVLNADAHARQHLEMDGFLLHGVVVYEG